MRLPGRPRPSQSGPTEAQLADEERFVERSLEDLERELADGAIEAEDYERLRARYEARAAELAGRRAALVGRADADPTAPKPDADQIAPQPAADETPPQADAAAHQDAPPEGAGLSVGQQHGRPSRRRRRRSFLAAAGACFVAAGLVLGLGLGGVAPFGTSPPPAGLTRSGRIATELAEASVLAREHNVVQAVAVYDKVLALDPRQPEALAEAGWLVRLAGLSGGRRELVTGGDAEIAAAVRYAPRYAVPRAYDAVALLEDRHDPKGAVRELDAMLDDHPSKTLVTSVRSNAVRAYEEAGAPVPAAFES